ncbi:putative sucrose utilization protein SUC1 [Paramyrothecium foliicola]|nr:putative sucrose utilization protein SUC1 [Paramyrothecium foliicola]
MNGRNSRACDACRVRKVKCSGGQPCSQCTHLDLTCHVAPRPGKRKPPIRGRLVAKLREINGPVNHGSTSPESPVAAKPLVGVASVPASVVGSTPSYPTLEAGNDDGPEDKYDLTYFESLIPDYEAHVYPVNPLVTSEEIRASFRNLHGSDEDAALAYAFAAVTTNLTKTSWTMEGNLVLQITDLVQRSLRAHRRAELGVCDLSGALGELPVSVKRITTCIFLEITFMAFKRLDRSFAILREAISMIHTLKVHEYSGTQNMEAHEVSRRQRLYWEAFIHERFMTIIAGFPSILPPLRTGLPFADDSIPSTIEAGFNRLIHLFQIMDQPFLSHWTSQHDQQSEAAPTTAHWVQSKLAQLDRDELRAAEDDKAAGATGRGVLTELQLADVFITRVWMRTLVWQLALSNRLLSSAPPQDSHEGLSLHFPVQRLSSELRGLVSRLASVTSVATHGSGILQKLFEITNTVADVMALPMLGLPTWTQQDVRARMEDFVFLVKFLFSFERIPKEQRDYLREKLVVLEEMYTMVDFSEVAKTSPVSV